MPTEHPTLFDEGGLVPYRIFVAAPSTGGYEREIAIIRQTCIVFGASLGRCMEVVVGDDAPTPDPRQVRPWIRARLLEDIDAVIIVHGPSWGCSHEDAVAGALGIPRLLAFRSDRPRSALAGSDGSDVVSEGNYESMEELQQVVRDWLSLARPEIDLHRTRRSEARRLAEPFRQACLQAWELLEEDEQTVIAREVGVARAHTLRVLMSPAEFAELHDGMVLFLATKLGVWDVNTRALRSGASPSLTDKQQRAFHQARSTWGWDDETAQHIWRVGIERVREERALHALGEPSRFSLNTRQGWHRLHREICGELDN